MDMWRALYVVLGVGLTGCSSNLEPSTVGNREPTVVPVPGTTPSSAGSRASGPVSAASSAAAGSAGRASTVVETVSAIAGTVSSSAGIGGLVPPIGAAGTAGRPAADGGIGPGVVSIPSGGPVVFEPNVRINDDTGNAQQSEVMIATRPDGLILAGFVDARSGTKCAYSVSRDGGKTWGKNLLVPSQGGSSGFTGDTTVAIDDKGVLYAVCQDYGSTKQILLATSSDSGATWSSFTSVQKSPDKPWIAGARDGTVFLSWLGSPGGFKRSLDAGKTWSTPISLGNLVHGTGISVSTDGIVHLAYNQGNSVRYSRSKDWGETLEMGRNLANQGTACFAPCSPRSHPIVANASDPTGKILAITWAATINGGDGDDDVWLLLSRDGGNTFSKPIRVNDNTNASRQFQPWVAVDAKGRVHVVWSDFRDGGKNATYYARLSAGEKFETNVQVTDGTGKPPSFMGDYKAIAIQGNDIVVAWCDSRRDGGGDIFFARAPGAAGP